MSFVSYAQNYEDVMLWRALKHVQNGFYIDLGAWSPDQDSVTRHFYENGWSGINVEPNEEFYALNLSCRPRDKNLKMAVGDKEGAVCLNIISNTGISTAIDAHAQRHEAAGWARTQHEVPLTTLAVICNEYIKPEQAIHFLKVDIEGLEEAALRGNDWATYRPWIVIVEATLPMTQIESYENWEPILLTAGYLFAYADGLNRFYVASEHVNLLAAFKYPPNVFDDFRLSSQQAAEEKVQFSEERARQAQDMAKHAQAREQQAQEKAQHAEEMAQQAEAVAQQYATQLFDVHKSTSWRITAPLRWSVRQSRLLRQHGAKARIKALIKKTLRKLILSVMARPTIRSWATRLAYRLGVAERLKFLVRSVLHSQQSGPSDRSSQVPLALNHAHLSPSARQIYADLKEAVAQQDRGDS